MYILDLNECEQWGYCEQRCENSKGNYTCSCVEGFTLKDKSQCSADKRLSMRLYFTHYNQIIKMDVFGQNREVVMDGKNRSVWGLDFHLKKGILFWSDVDARTVSITLWHFDMTSFSEASVNEEVESVGLARFSTENMSRKQK